ncbi:phosphoadenosine phosphosulfate reductase domain-containing protein [Methanoplanus endosymbiosus]|uniref:Phosphoadenosine phosphosulfate reductase family protein n=1 Tax=Methanoplanus endosymbiosus TaxID=33865 RepID=A0A9E7THP6_9EURY|nr:phosphoadenosine phosphosulfate reductase family protein [Methanoplanus endosymbiosus]UUX93327.1 phosphoadenosine phosphosulfate reductase family protein [Methanoplanus endosymbiosus]
MKREPSAKNNLNWCKNCNIPLIGKTCSCGSEPKNIPLLRPYEIRPALSADYKLIKTLIEDKFGEIPLSQVILLNKTGGADRNDLIIMNGERLGWLIFDPVKREHRFDIAVEALPFIFSHITKGIIDIYTDTNYSKEQGRIGGKKLKLNSPVENGTYIVKYKAKAGTGIVKDGSIKIKELIQILPQEVPDPDWDEVIQKNKYHLKNLERSAVRSIKQHINDRPTANVSFSGGKDSTVVLHLGQKAGIKKAFFIDTGLEFPETIEFVESKDLDIIRKGGDFWKKTETDGPPSKDSRWCCKLLKLIPLNGYLSEIGPCVTVQGNRWYESWNRADLEETIENPGNPLQLNISPIRSWRAFEVFLYIWWQDLEVNPLYEKGLERIGCYLCPAMLESEYEVVRNLHPEFTESWDKFLTLWAEKNGFPDEYVKWGLWRWKSLPPKMKEICRDNGIPINYGNSTDTEPSDNRVKAGEPKLRRTHEPSRNLMPAGKKKNTEKSSVSKKEKTKRKNIR